MLLEAETNKYCPSGYDIGAISNLITWVLSFFLSACQSWASLDAPTRPWASLTGPWRHWAILTGPWRH